MQKFTVTVTVPEDGAKLILREISENRATLDERIELVQQSHEAKFGHRVNVEVVDEGEATEAEISEFLIKLFLEASGVAFLEASGVATGLSEIVEL